MKTGSEGAAWKAIRKEMKSRGLHFQRFEDKLAEGVPDVILQADGARYVWAELKQCPMPKSEEAKLTFDLRTAQCAWIKGATHKGAACVVVAKVGVLWAVWTDHWQELRDGMSVRRMRETAETFGSASSMLDYVIKQGVTL